jgi:type VI secretion system protein ImpL
LIDCVEIIFEKNERKEHAGLRGLYFSSSHQKQVTTLVSVPDDSGRFIRSLSGGGLFLKESFIKIIFNDQYPVRPSGRRKGLHQLSGSLAVVSVVLCSLVFGALLTLSFTKNLKEMRNAYNVMPPSDTVNHNLFNDISTADQFRASILKLDDNLNQLWHPLMGLRQAESISGVLKDVYVMRYKEGVIRPLDILLDKSLIKAPEETSLLHVENHITYLARRINLFRTSIKSPRRDNRNVEGNKTPYFHFLLNVPDNELKNTSSDHLARTYNTYLQWQRDKNELHKGLLADQNRMKALLDRKGRGLNWLTRWASSQGKSAFPGTTSYWGENKKLPDGKSLVIDFAYTPEGWRRVNEVLAEIELANKDSKNFSNLKRRYLESYRIAYFNHWELFLSNFYQGQGIWTGRESRIDLAHNLSKNNSPYYRVIHDAAIALEPVRGLAHDAVQTPPWVNLLYRFIKLSTADQDKTVKDGLLVKITDKSKSLLNKVGRQHRSVDTHSLEKQYILDKEAIVYLNEYKESLRDMVRHLKTPESAYQLVSAVFHESSASTGIVKQSVNKNARFLVKLKQKLGKGNANEEVFWQLLSNQMNQIWHVLLEEAQIHLQYKWQQGVLAEEPGLNGWELIDRLQGVDGAAWQFKKAELASFLQVNSITGYKSRQLYGGHIQFSKKFIGFLNRRALEADAINGSYSVNISTLPTDVNVEASVKPHETRLTVYCLNGDQGLLNQNYPVSRLFVWSPRDCGNVEIVIKIGKLKLTKLYTGYRAFIRFLDDFHTGKKVFDIGDFPGQRRALEAYSVHAITVSYDISGHERIARLQSRSPGLVPDKIIAMKDG